MTFVPMTYGVLIGAYAGYRGGWVDKVVVGVVDIAIAFPFLVMIIVVVAVLGPGFRTSTSRSFWWPGRCMRGSPAPR